MKLIYPRKKTRNAIYREAIKVYKEESYAKTGLCAVLSKALVRLNRTDLPHPYSYMECYPEIYKYKPNNHKYYWFAKNRTKKRIDILKQAIKETES